MVSPETELSAPKTKGPERSACSILQPNLGVPSGSPSCEKSTATLWEEELGRGLLPTEAEAPFSPHSWLWGDTATRGAGQLEAKQKLNLIPTCSPPQSPPCSSQPPHIKHQPRGRGGGGELAISSLKHRPYLRDKGFAPGLLCLSPFPAAPPFPDFSISPPPQP